MGDDHCSSKSKGSQRHLEERGAAAVEFALIVPLLLTVLMGIIDFGIIYNGWISLRQGTREAARQGSVANFGTTASCSLTFAGGGSAPSTDLQKLMCLAKSQIGLDATATRTKVIVSDYALQNGGASWSVGNSLIVCAQFPASSQTGFFGPTLGGHYLRTKTAIRIEQPASGPETEGFETDQSGGGWAWCSASSSSP
jgi:hypothetical protein